MSIEKGEMDAARGYPVQNPYADRNLSMTERTTGGLPISFVSIAMILFIIYLLSNGAL